MAISAIAALVTLTRVDAQTAGPGAIPGDFSVDNKGTANYTVPLALPPSRGSVDLKLALDYNSGGGNGHEGIGWSLSTGMPQAITRGRTILARDGVVRGVNFDSGDKFYLDGKRLICVSGTYGQAGSTYRTEVDSFVTISATGSGSTIDGFTMTDKGGLTYYFGKYNGTTDAYHMGGGETQGLAMSWALKKVEDRTGYYVEFNYDNLNVNGNYSGNPLGEGEHLLSSVDYGGNDLATLNPTFEVRFAYEDRDDECFSYTDGRQTWVTKRLHEIDVMDVTSTPTAVRKYQLDYTYPTVNTRFGESDTAGSVLQKVELLDGSGSTVLSPSVFQYTQQAVHFSDAASTLQETYSVGGSVPFNHVIRSVQADLNHDGVVDPIYRFSTGNSAAPFGIGVVFSKKGGGYSAPTPVYTSLRYVYQVFPADFNGDGNVDLVFFASSASMTGGDKNGGWYVALSDGNGGFATPVKVVDEQPLPGVASYRPGGCEVTDVDGDGLPDIVVTLDDGDNWLWARNMPFSASCDMNLFYNCFDSSADTTDYTNESDADAAELLWVQRQQYNNAADYLVVYKNTSSDTTPSVDSYQYAKDQNGNKIDMQGIAMRMADFTGDGLPDLMFEVGDTQFDSDQSCEPVWQETDVNFYVNQGGYVFKWISAAENDFTFECNNSNVLPAAQYLTGDFNGDGKTDLLRLIEPNTQDCVLDVISNPNDISIGWSVGIARGDGTFDWHSFGSIPNQVTYNGNTIPTYNKTDGYWTCQWVPDSSGGQIVQMDTIVPTVCDGFSVRDVNNDGLDDFVWLNHGDAYYCILSEGDHFDEKPVTVNGTTTQQINPIKLIADNGMEASPGAIRTFWGDATGNLASDLLFYRFNYDGQGNYTSQQIFAAENASGTGIRLSGVTDGLGETTSINYLPTSDSSVYTPGVKTQYPIVEAGGHNYVVSDVYKDAGSGSSADDAHYLYQYSGYRMDLSGRGSLGFHSFVTLDEQTHLFKYQFLTQSFPMTGLTAREQTYRYWESGSNTDFRLITSHDNTVVFDEVGSYGTAYPFISKAVESRWEDSTTAQFSFAKTDTSGGDESQSELLFPEALPSGAYTTVTATSLFDNQTTPQTTLPGPFQPSDTNSSHQNVVSGKTAFGTYLTGSFPHQITYGNLTETNTDYGDGYTEKTDTTYYPSTGGLTGLVDTQTNTVTSPNYGTQTSPTTSYTYWSNGSTQTPLVHTKTVDCTGTALDLTTTYTRDSRGRVTDTAISGDSNTGDAQYIGSYTTSHVDAFDSRFDLPTTQEDAYQHTTTTVYDPVFGKPSSVTDANGETTITQYDPAGRQTLTKDNLTGIETDTTYGFTSSSPSETWEQAQTVTPPSLTGALTLSSVYAVHTVTKGPDANLKPPATVYYDRLGRAIRTIKDDFGGGTTISDTIYNNLGQTVAASLPYASGGTEYWTETVYDALGRVSSVTAPNNTVTTHVYDGRVHQVTVDATDRNPQTNTTLVDAKGRTVKVWNADNVPATLDPVTGSTQEASVAYDLDGFGRMRATTLRGQSQQVTATYDDLGHQTELNDPDKGDWTYLTNALGEMVKQTDGRGDVTTTAYDHLGRKLTTTVAEPNSGPVETDFWYYYDTTANAAEHTVALGNQGWIGSLEREESSTSGAPGYAASGTTTVHYYDSMGRPHIDLTQVDGKWFYTYTDYDADSRVSGVTRYWRPAAEAGTSNHPYVWNDYGYTNTYDANSYLTKVSDSTGKTWWEAEATDGYDYLDRPVKFTAGSGYLTTRTYDPETGNLTNIVTNGVQDLAYGYDGLGNLTSRTDNLHTLSETFNYDDLNRLTTQNGNQIASYADNGNIQWKVDVNGVKSANYTYDSTRPHAVATAWGYTMTYDADGNLATRTGNGHTWTTRWAGYDKPRWLAKDGKGNEFIYNAEHNRVINLEFDSMANGAPEHYTKKKLYALGTDVELEYRNTITSGTGQDWQMSKVRVYVPGPDGTVGTMEFDPTLPAADAQTALVYHYDHLGSIECITPFGSTTGHYAADGSGRPSLYSYDPWGQRRNATTWSGAPDTTTHGGADDLTPRGFTGHEMLDDLGLVHMNGRIYDPLIGRFLSADEIVDGAGSSQGFNRYSYVHNNPLRFTDPTGFWRFLAALGLDGGAGEFNVGWEDGNLTLGWGAGAGSGAKFEFEPSGQPKPQVIRSLTSDTKGLFNSNGVISADEGFLASEGFEFGPNAGGAITASADAGLDSNGNVTAEVNASISASLSSNSSFGRNNDGSLSGNFHFAIRTTLQDAISLEPASKKATYHLGASASHNYQIGGFAVYRQQVHLNVKKAWRQTHGKVRKAWNWVKRKVSNVFHHHSAKSGKNDEKSDNSAKNVKWKNDNFNFLNSWS